MYTCKWKSREKRLHLQINILLRKKNKVDHEIASPLENLLLPSRTQARKETNCFVVL